jgi:hypothetical protein
VRLHKAFVAAAALTAQLCAWGPQGHKAVAAIATGHLTPRASKEVESLLGSGVSLEDIAVWADDIRRDRPDTAPWHYINVPVKVKRGFLASFCPEGGCITKKIPELITVLRNPQSSRESREEALKFLVHFVGDLHQPLHVGDRGDRGGNDLDVTFFGDKTNLHSAWDSAIPGRANPLPRAASPAEFNKNRAGSVEDWAWEAHDISRDFVYKNLGNPAQIGEAYQKKASEIVRRQILRAGVRLAATLNSIWP